MADVTIARERLDKEAALNSLKDQVEAQKMALENEWTKIEMRSADLKRASDERQAEIAARETQMREQNDAAKIAADDRAAELEALTAERTYQIEQQRLALEARKLELQERELGATMLANAPAPQTTQQPMTNAEMQQIMQAMMEMHESNRMGQEELRKGQAALIKAAKAKKRVMRDDAGKVLGVETVEEDDE